MTQVLVMMQVQTTVSDQQLAMTGIVKKRLILITIMMQVGTRVYYQELSLELNHNQKLQKL